MLLPLGAAIMGVALGASFVAGYLYTPAQEQQYATPHDNKSDTQTTEKRHQTTEEAIAYYNK
jgi:hypothetical protein